MGAEQVSTVANTISSNINIGLYSQMINILTIIALFFLFEENKEAGWKAIIPFYGTYIQYKLFYKKGMFWLLVLCEVIFFAALIGLAFLGVVVRSGAPITDAQGGFFITLLALGGIAILIIAIIDICFKVSLAKKYDKGILFVFGLIFFEPFMLLYLAWDNRGKLKK